MICLFAGLPTQPVREPLEKRKYVALVSGLCIGEPALDIPKTMLLMDWVKGLFGNADQCKDVVRLVVCGTFCAAMPSLQLRLQLPCLLLHAPLLQETMPTYCVLTARHPALT